MGTAVGVVVIPKGFAPDGKVRVVALRHANSYKKTYWADWYSDVAIENYTRVPTSANSEGSSVSFNSYNGYCASDSYSSGTICYEDPVCKYEYNTKTILSPYITRNGLFSVNPDYYKESVNGNAASDFDGENNTSIIMQKGTGYAAAHAAHNYSDQVSNLCWYLPSVGEIIYLISRKGAIQNSMDVLGGETVGSPLWTSTEFDASYAYYVAGGYLNYNYKDNSYYILPFAKIDL